MDASNIEIVFYLGHIRNWKQLCLELNIEFGQCNRCDRERMIILRAFLEWGKDMPNHLIGMFSFALKIENGELYCARDHFGLKPLYFLELPDTILVSTNVGDILKDTRYNKELDVIALQHYLSYTYVAGRNTLFKGIKKLLPGEYLLWDGQECRISKYWTPSFKVDESKSLEEWSILLHEKLQEVIDELIEPEEMGNSSVLLSAGVDSSYILGLCGVKKTHTVGFYEKEYDESIHTRNFAKSLNRENYVLKISRTDFLKNTSDAIKCLELPIGTPATVAYGMGCSFASKGASVCLSGEGADEFFCGYDVYKEFDLYGDNIWGKYIGKANIMNEAFKRILLKDYVDGVKVSDAIVEQECMSKGIDTITQMSQIDICVWLEGNSLLNIHRMSSTNGVEVRPPFVDVRIFDIVSKIPSKYKVNLTNNKIVLRKAASNILSEEIAYRDKSGFVIPMRYWLKTEEYKKEIVKKFNSGCARELFEQSELHNLFDRYLNGELDLWKQIWNIYVFIVWYELFM